MFLGRTLSEVHSRVGAWRAAGKRVALVPTMGNIHRGHLALIAEAEKHADKVSVSIFVNPIQFDDEEDLRAYPETFDADIEALRTQKVAFVFAPAREEMYPADHGHGLHVDAGDIAEVLCGASRPGHFAGVATVIVKLFNVFKPDVAVFGEKDYQQLVLVRRLVEWLNFDVRIVAVPTVRESSGLALSSRNSYLNGEQKQRAATLYRVLRATASRLKHSDGKDTIKRLLGEARDQLESAGLVPDYVELRDLHTLGPIISAESRSGSRIVLGAAWVGKTRLIDNVIVDSSAA